MSEEYEIKELVMRNKLSSAADQYAEQVAAVQTKYQRAIDK